MKQYSLGILLLCLSLPAFGMKVFDMEEIRDPSTLEIRILQDWHPVKGIIETRQKLVTINVGDLWPEQEYRVPVRMVVPAKGRVRPDESLLLQSSDKVEELPSYSALFTAPGILRITLAMGYLWFTASQIAVAMDYLFILKLMKEPASLFGSLFPKKLILTRHLQI